jgi:lipoprotein-anchoring transpeptidase ErfK/SrfK
MSRRRVAIVATSVAVPLLVAAGAVYAYDAGHSDRIAPGMRIGGVEVGGMSADAARAKLRRDLVTPLERPVVVTAGSRTFRLTAREAQVKVNTGELVDRAVASSRQGSFVSRAWRDATGAKVDADVSPTIAFSKGAVQRLVDRVRVRTTQQPKDATVKIRTTAVEVHKSQAGRTVDATALKAKVQAALIDTRSARRMHASIHTVQPKVTTAKLADQYPSIVTVDRGRHRLRLFKKLKLEKSYTVAVGMAGLETPAGEYKIQNMAENPSWHVPQSAWAGDLAGTVVPPGPTNPIKARWMGIYDGAGIHGTDDVNSIGTSASHGCVRMRIPDVEDLYSRVSVGTPVLIV